MTKYIVPNKQRVLLLAGIALGVVSLILTWMGDDAHHSRFWSNFLHNSVFFTGISFMAVFFYAVCNTAWAGWHTVFKRVWEAMGMFLVVGIVLIGILSLGVAFDFHHLYHWDDPASVESDKILTHKSTFLNSFWYSMSLGVVVVWLLFAWIFRSRSIREDEQDYDPEFTIHKKTRWWTALFLPIAGFSSCLVIWQWVMSLDAHWYSTLFAWYSGASLFVSMIAITILILIYLKSQGYYPNVSLEHFHDLGKFLFAFSIFWTYLWFSQYMLIWYANVGEETVYFKTRQDHFPVLFYANLAINFLVPFFILMRNDTKRKFGTLIFVSLVVFFGHWMDYFLMVKPGVMHTAHELSHHEAPQQEASHDEQSTHLTDHLDEHGPSEQADPHTAASDDHGSEGHHDGGHGSHYQSGFTIPGLLEIGTMIGFLSLFLLVFYNVLSRSNLVAKNDPYLSESLHHHV